MPSIKIENPHSGWLTFSISDHSFTVSYLSDFKGEMEYLLDLPDGDMEVKRIMLDGEEKLLYLTAWRYFDYLFIVWEEYGDGVKTDIMKFDYKEFIKDYRSAFDKIKGVYKKHFECI